MRRDVFHFLGCDVVEIDIGIRSRVRFAECDELLVIGDVTKLISLGVLVEQLSLVALRIHSIYVKEFRVSFICRDVKRLAILSPSKELGLELVTGCQVFFFFVLPDVDVIVLVPALVVRIHKARVIRKVADAEGALGGGLSELLHVSAGDWNRVDVIDSALITRNENRFLIGRKRAASDSGSVKELLDGVLLDGSGSVGALATLACRCDFVAFSCLTAFGGGLAQTWKR